MGKSDDNKFGAPFPELREICAQNRLLTITALNELRALLTYYVRAIGTNLSKDIGDDLDEALRAVEGVQDSLRHTADLFREMD